MDKREEYLVRLERRSEHEVMLTGPGGDSCIIDDGEYDEAEEQTSGTGWNIDETIILMFGSWVCDYPDVLESTDDVFTESVELENDDVYTLILQYNDGQEDENDA